MRKRKRRLRKSVKLTLILLASFIALGTCLCLLLQAITHSVYYNYRFSKPKKVDMLPVNHYREDHYYYENQILHYEDEKYTSRFGIDVSSHNGDIDWQKVKEDGVEFVFLRIGYRGYEKGNIQKDQRFEEYYKGAKEVELDIGVYFFSQATTIEEAMDEAFFVLEELKFKKINLPIVYDYEEIDYDDSRINHLSKEERSNNALAFMQKVEENHYETMCYTNLYWANTFFDLSLISNYPVWFAYYGSLPTWPYDYKYLQYSEEGTIDGIKEKVDLNIAYTLR